MSWNPLKKSSGEPKSSSSTSATLTSGSSTTNPKVILDEIDKLVCDFDSAENGLRTILSSAKKIPDTILCMNKFEKQITEDLSNSGQFTPDTRFRNIVEEWHSFACQSDQAGEDFVIVLQKVLINPLKEMKQAFAQMRQAIKHRDTVKSDTVKLQRKVAQLSEKEKTGPNLVKLEENKQLLASSQKESKRYNEILQSELRKFISGIVELFQPSLESSMLAEVFWAKTIDKLSNDQHQTKHECDGRSLSELTRSIDDQFKKLNSLTICPEFPA